MLTTEDIRSVELTKVLGGYKISEVDDFLDQCADTVKALTEEKDGLNKKLEILADKLLEYRNEEDSIRTALLSAQRLGDTIVREANQKSSLAMEDAGIRSEKIVADAEKKAAAIIEEARGKIKAEEEELARLKKEVSNFKSKMLTIYTEHLSCIGLLPEEEPEQKEESATAEEVVVFEQVEAVSAEEPAEGPIVEEEIASEKPVEPIVTEETDSRPIFTIAELAEEEKEPTKVADPVRAASHFGDLKFGDDYDISADSAENDGGKGFFKRKK